MDPVPFRLDRAEELTTNTDLSIVYANTKRIKYKSPPVLPEEVEFRWFDLATGIGDNYDLRHALSCFTAEEGQKDEWVPKRWWWK